MPYPSAENKRETSASRTTTLFWILLVLLTVAAFAIRLYHLDQLPAGLFYDEAYEGLDAHSLFGKPFWEWPLFFTAINGREPLFVYLVHLAQHFWGASILSVRMVSAGAGALLTPALVWLGWAIAPELGVRARRRFALWVGMASLALLWPQIISRLGQRISLFGLVETLLFAALWRAWRTNRRVWWMVAGIAAGLSFYTYLAVRLLPLVLLPVAALLLWRHRGQVQARRRGIALSAGLALLVAAPLLLHFARHPAHFNMRTSQVNILQQGGIPALLHNVGAVLGMAFWRGDYNIRLNYPARPVLDVFTTVPFLIGFLVLLRRFWRPAFLFVLSGLGVMLLPTLLSEEAPNFGRAFGALPFFVLIIGLGLDRLGTWAGCRLPPAKRYVGVAGGLLLLGSTILAGRVFLVQWPRLPAFFASWDTGYTALAQDIAAIPGQSPFPLDRIYAASQAAENPSLHYLLADSPAGLQPQGFDGRFCLRIAMDRPARYYVLTTLDPRGAPLLHSYLPDSRSRVVVTDDKGDEWARVVTQPPGGRILFPERIPLSVSFSDGIGLTGYWLSQEGGLQPGQRLYVRLFWRVSAVPSHSYTTFVHLVQRDGAEDTVRLAGADALPGNGSCLTADWLPKEVVVDEVELALPADLAAGEYYLVVGMYILKDGRRLNVPGSDHNWVWIGPLEVRE